MKKVSIKHYGVIISIPTEILVVSACGSISANTHLVLDKAMFPVSKYSKGLEERFVILRKNGESVFGHSWTPTVIDQLDYRECSLEQFAKLKAFL